MADAESGDEGGVQSAAERTSDAESGGEGGAHSAAERKQGRRAEANNEWPTQKRR